MLTITFRTNIPSLPGTAPDTHLAVLPDRLLNNHILHNGQEFVATGLNAAYMLRAYASGANPLLSVVSITYPGDEAQPAQNRSFNSSFNSSFG